MGTWEHSFSNMEGMHYVQLVINEDLSSRYMNIDPKNDSVMQSSSSDFSQNDSIYSFNYFNDGKLVAKLVVSGWNSDYTDSKLMFGHLFLYEFDEAKLYTGMAVQFVPEKSMPMAKRLEQLDEALKLMNKQAAEKK